LTGTNSITFNNATAPLTGDIQITNAGDSLSLQTNVANTTVANVIKGGGNISKDGPNTITLSAVNTFTGSATINAGTLTIAAGGSITPSSVTNNANFINNGTVTTPGNVTNNLSGTVDNNGTMTLTAGDLNNDGTFNNNAGGTLTLTVGDLNNNGTFN